jgi:hypothetical protein
VLITATGAANADRDTSPGRRDWPYVNQPSQVSLVTFDGSAQNNLHRLGITSLGLLKRAQLTSTMPPSSDFRAAKH